MSPHLSSTYLSTPTQYEHALLKIETRMQQEVWADKWMSCRNIATRIFLIKHLYNVMI